MIYEPYSKFQTLKFYQFLGLREFFHFRISSIGLILYIIGIIEIEDKHQLKTELPERCKILDQLEREILNKGENYIPKFSKYLQDKRKSVLKKLIRDARRQLFNITDPDVAPPRVYTNQSESVNNVLASRKANLGFRKKDDVPKVSLVNLNCYSRVHFIMASSHRISHH